MIVDLPTPQPWMASALCAQVDGDLWFPEQGDHQSARDAKATCRRCPVINDCLRFALDQAPREGIWGGLTPKERNKVSPRRPGERRQPTIAHGTEAGYKAHRRCGEDACNACASASRTARLWRAS